MGMSGAPLPYYVTYLDPTSAFNLHLLRSQRRNANDRRQTSWVGPIIGAVLLGTIQQLATVTIFLGAQPPDRRGLLILFVGLPPMACRAGAEPRRARAG